jgi:hypothetical protein
MCPGVAPTPGLWTVNFPTTWSAGQAVTITITGSMQYKGICFLRTIGCDFDNSLQAILLRRATELLICQQEESPPVAVLQL